MDYTSLFLDRLRSIESASRLRDLIAREGIGGRVTRDGGESVLNFSSNDYLDLARDARVKQAAVSALDRYGTGATASRLMAGTLDIHERLETCLAGLVNQPAALTFPAGFQMNLGVISALFDNEGWTLFSDALNHASLIDGCRLSRAQVQVYPHQDLEVLATLLEDAAGPKAIITESVFSMDGDLAPLQALDALAKEHGAMLVVDEAHAIGIHGRGGGLCVGCGIRPDITLGTLGKSLGSAGGFVAASDLICRVLVNTARSFIFSTGLNPASAAAALESARIVESDPEMGRRLIDRSRQFRGLLRESGFDVREDDSPIVPIVLGSNEDALRVAQALDDEGIMATAIRPPTVPEDTSRLRLSVTLAHTHEDLARTAQAVARAAKPFAAKV